MANNQYTPEGKKRKEQYIAKYNKRTYRSICIGFRVDDAEQMEAWDWIHTKYSTAGYIRDLIIAAMKKEKEGN